MFILQRVVSLPVLLSAALIAHAWAAPEGFISMGGGPGRQYAATLTGGERCNDREIQEIRAGFDEMNLLFQSALPLNWNADAEREFFGRRERIANHTDLVESNLRRATQYAALVGNATRMPDIHIRCDDPNDICDEGNKKEGKHAAYNIGNEPHINFCKPYFGLKSLEKAVDEAAKGPATNMNIMAYYNRATAWARQILHISAVGSAIVEKAVAPVLSPSTNSSNTWITQMYNAPMNTSVLAGVMNERPKTDGPNDIQTLKFAYGATRAKLVATLSTQQSYDAVNNAENYALFAQARYVIEKKRIYPAEPVILVNNEAAILANNELQAGGGKRYACFDMSDVVPRNQRTSSIGAPLTSLATPIRGKNRHPLLVVYSISLVFLLS
ncbi:hypothetical protein B0J11DRAFT_537479 [Dendryphion nanum]|uniref:Uncharacterized protein n=1 Tax=Dendryphion nanum TaxID=256645 RepID=A0A9P9IES1_9PLEO|nr:hypothetical protein B0J11DRAFT_537479 [Dendryphion nanum]